MASITHNGTTYPFRFLSGLVIPLAQTAVEITRPGVDGHAFRRNARRGTPFTMTGIVDFDTLADARSRYVAMMALQTQIVSIEDDYGDTYDNLYVATVRGQPPRGMVKISGGLSALGRAELVVEFDMQSTQ